MSGPVDPKKIAEALATVDEVTRPAVDAESKIRDYPEAGEPDCCPYHVGLWVKMRDALLVFRAAREEMLALLREVGEPGVLTCDEEHDFVSAPREGCACRLCDLATRLAAFLGR